MYVDYLKAFAKVCQRFLFIGALLVLGSSIVISLAHSFFWCLIFLHSIACFFCVFLFFLLSLSLYISFLGCLLISSFLSLFDSSFCLLCFFCVGFLMFWWFCLHCMLSDLSSISIFRSLFLVNSFLFSFLLPFAFFQTFVSFLFSFSAFILILFSVFGFFRVFKSICSPTLYISAAINLSLLLYTSIYIIWFFNALWERLLLLALAMPFFDIIGSPCSFLLVCLKKFFKKNHWNDRMYNSYHE